MNSHRSAQAFFARAAGLIAMFLTVTLLMTANAFADTKRKFITIGSGQPGGIYYPIAQSLCRLLNDKMGKQGYYCSAEPTAGSLYNLDALARGEIDFALVQADSHYQAVKGLGEWEGRPLTTLRSVMSLYPETFTILARPDSGVIGVDSLRGKRINIGSPGSGTRDTWNEMEVALGLQHSDFSLVSELRQDAAAEMLCSNELDVSVQMIGHPSETIQGQVKACELIIVPATGSKIDQLVIDRPYFVPSIIPGEVYGLPSDVLSFGGKATLVTTAAVSDVDVESLTKAVIAGLESLRASQAALSGLRIEDMIRHSLTAPLHDGAKRAYQELGLTTGQ